MARSVDQMEQVVKTVVVVDHATCLGLDGDASFALHVELIQDLLVATGSNGSCELE